MQLKPFIDAQDARLMLEVAITAAEEANLAMSVAVVDAAGYPIALQRMDRAGLMTADVALRKARTAALLRAPSRVLADRVAADPALLRLTDYLPMAGGLPVLADGAVAGAIGVSGGTPDQDETVGKAGVAALER